jgi:hypothetical protein
MKKTNLIIATITAIAGFALELVIDYVCGDKPVLQTFILVFAVLIAISCWYISRLKKPN